MSNFPWQAFWWLCPLVCTTSTFYLLATFTTFIYLSIFPWRQYTRANKNCQERKIVSEELLVCIRLMPKVKQFTCFVAFICFILWVFLFFLLPCRHDFIQFTFSSISSFLLSSFLGFFIFAKRRDQIFSFNPLFNLQNEIIRRLSKVPNRQETLPRQVLLEGFRSATMFISRRRCVDAVKFYLLFSSMSFDE